MLPPDIFNVTKCNSRMIIQFQFETINFKVNDSIRGKIAFTIM